MKFPKWAIPILVFLFSFITVLSVFYYLLSAPNPSSKEKSVFIVPAGKTNDEAIKDLQAQGFIRSISAFKYLHQYSKFGNVFPGGYYLSKNMPSWEVAAKIYTHTPDLEWFTFPEGMRKEQIGETLARELHWDTTELDKWNTEYTTSSPDYIEGVYFPDTYLIPVKESGSDIARRMINRFNEKFAGYPGKFSQADILWTTGLRLASVIQREAGGKDDMPLISGILWNRLLKKMKLEVDATVQYARGKTSAGWWAPVKPSDMKIDSPYNTYLNIGLPPHPICNPGMDAIDAALHPEQTTCLFYLHDANRQIHCADTYAEHLKNIDKYLKQ